ncbi:hypothetical protein D9M71_805190 [compost metagenome]
MGLYVGASGERPACRATQYHRAYIIIVTDMRPQVIELAHHGQGERVHRFWTVEGDGADAIVGKVEQQGCVFHGRTL